ncbi:monocarboxylate transporter 10 isoform X2 [Nematostella vectensis]|nr:monocarboxylate transporter 10 isoform X2 [Nematostella vectensis]
MRLDRKWFVCIGAFVIHFVVGGLMNSGGVLLSALIDKFGKPRGDTAWVSSLPCSVVYFCAPISTHVCQRYGCRLSITLGLLLCIIGLVSSAFVTSLYLLYFTYGILLGSGWSMIYFSAFLSVAWYFKASQHAFGNGIATSGGSLGTMALSPLNELLFRKIGTRYTFLVMVGYFGALLLPLAAFRPIPTEYEPVSVSAAQEQPRQPPVLRNYGYIALVSSMSLFMTVYLVPYIHVVRFAEDLGASKLNAALLISFLAISSFTGRIVFGRISDLKCCNRLRIVQVSFVVIGASTALLSIAPSYPWIVGYVIVFGLSEGCYMALNAVVTCDVVGKGKLPQALGMSYFLMSFTRTVGAPIAGWMYDAKKSYTLAFIVMGSVSGLAAFLMGFVPTLKRISENNTSNNVEVQEKYATIDGMKGVVQGLEKSKS